TPMPVGRRVRVENANRRFRHRLPRGNELDVISEENIQKIRPDYQPHSAQMPQLSISDRGAPIRAWQRRRNQVCLNHRTLRRNPSSLGSTRTMYVTPPLSSQ